ncbi:hypothetical protein BSL82_14525 [Tardibacter chloracetimidivorans]|uniref:Sulfatase maturase n=1 Tax=Tardibacter chloracetimidivorans TaxID=1921510 RepID=A0A1L3ZXJ7_9SPHN|nr:ergothioneine biosynthesis protein EgtB [Tardibacter chloracetimidivorans]API60351.1 hypothetical protein BSL82_14525 [Tardibacter chloracetimidivorans]
MHRTVRAAASEEALAHRFHDTRRLSCALAAPLSDADATVQSMPDASPAKWHLAHTSWFFEAFILRDVAGYEPFDPSYAYLFNSYYESEGARQPRPLRGMLTRPSLDRVLDYRRHVDAAMEAVLQTPSPRQAELAELGVNHEQQHQELMLTDLLHLFAQNPLHPAYAAPEHRLDGVPEPLDWVAFDGGIVRAGHEGDGFAFDCEAPAHDALLAPYALADRPVTNAEWRSFIDDGGYRRPELWLSDGWTWVQAEGAEAPLYWTPAAEKGRWLRFGLDGLHPIEPAAAVTHINYYEADAYARWAGARLPTEAEWEHAGSGLTPDAGHFLDDAGPVRPRATGPGDGLRDMFGNVWEWTGSAYLPYPGFAPAEGAVGEYNGKFMCGQFVLKGGSCATPRGHARASYRNFFYPHQRWQFTGLRLAKSL